MKRMLATLIALGLASTAQAGDWTTTYGTMTLPDTPGDLRIFADYSVDSGRIIGRMEIDGGEPVIMGAWVEGSSGAPCPTSMDGSQAWGTVRLEFNADYTAFNGNWGYCDGPMNKSWTGTLGASRGAFQDR